MSKEEKVLVKRKQIPMNLKRNWKEIYLFKRMF